MRMDKIIIDQSASGAGQNGVVPFLPLDQLQRRAPAGGNAAPGTTQGTTR